MAVQTVAVFALVLAPLRASTASAQGPQGLMPDLRSIVLSANDMPGFSLDAGRTGVQNRPDGSVSYDSVYTRGGGTGPSEVRLAAARTASGKASMQSLAATRDALLTAGWTIRAVPLLGDEAVGFEASGAPAGGASGAGYGYVFRYGRHMVGAILTGPSTSTNFDHALGYAVQMSARLDAMLALAPVTDPDPAPFGAVASAPPTTPSSSNSAANPPVTAANAASTTPPPDANRTRPDPGTQAALPPATTRPSVSVATVLSDVRLDDAPELRNGFRLGGFSGLAAPDTSGTTFVTVTDRGPNGEITVNGKKEQVFPIPEYTPRIVKLRLDGQRMTVTETIPLRLPEGFTDSVTGTREISGLPAFSGSGELAVSPDGKTQYGTDSNGVDTEGIAIDSRDGSYWLADEYGPSILHVAADGTLLLRITPKGLGLSMDGVSVRELIPEVFRKRKPNRGFEGIAIAPDGSRLFVMLQTPLLNPDEKSGEASRHVRVAAFDTSDANNPKLSGVYVYLMSLASDVGAGAQDDLKIGDISGVSRTSFIVAERNSAEGGQHQKVYLVDVSGATDVSNKDTVNGRAIEQASESDFNMAGMRYIGKKLAVDLAKLGFSADKFEGLALVDPTTIAVVNDNDFGVGAIDTRGKVVRNGAMPRLVVVRIPEPLQ